MKRIILPSLALVVLSASALSTSMFSNDDRITSLLSRTRSVSAIEMLSVPVATDDVATTALDTPINIAPLANDDFGTDGPSAAAITVVSATNGMAMVNDGGTPADPTDDTIDYTPNLGFTGDDQITYEICDIDSECDQAMITVTVGTCLDNATADCDGDGINNGDETTGGSDPSDSCDPNVDALGTNDCDNDGLDNDGETLAGTDNENPDTDGDGVNDGAEVTALSDPNDSCDPNVDALGTNDCDNDGLDNDGETLAGTDNENPDTDGDGVNDGAEVTALSDPNDSCDPDINALGTNDCDNDGLDNDAEDAAGTDNDNPDTDGDGVNDGEEVADGSDPDDACDPDPTAVPTAGCVVFYEDFSNGLDGSTTAGAWTVSDNADNTIWHMNTPTSPDGNYTGDSDPLNSDTDGNGWVIFDIDQYIVDNPTWGEGDGAYTTGYLTSPELDFGDMASVLVEFQQLFIYCCFPFSPLTLEVSIDGQETWLPFPAQGDFVESANSFSDNPQETVVDISCAAAYQPSVYLRFAYNSAEEPGYNQYFWGIDDVKVYQNTRLNDILVTEITTGNIFTSWEFRVTPFEQRVLEEDGGLVAGVIFTNRGLNAQTNVTMLTEILDEANNVIYTYETDPFEVLSATTSDECPSYIYDTIYVATGFEPEAIGIYNIRVTVAGEVADDTPNNNFKKKEFQYSVDEYGHDNPDDLVGYLPSAQVSGSNPVEYQPSGWGSYYVCPNLGSTAYGVAARFGNSSADGVEFKAALIQRDPSVSLTNSETIAEEYYLMASNWHNGAYQYFPFENSVDLDTAQAYFACIWKETESSGNLTIGVQEEPDSDLSTAYWEMAGNGEYVWFSFQPYTPSVRLILSDRVGIDEAVNTAGLNSFSVYPNPAVSETRVQFNLEGSRSIAYEIRDLTGKLIQWENVGSYPQGENSFTVNVNKIAAGNYLLNLVIDGSAMFTQQLSIQK